MSSLKKNANLRPVEEVVETLRKDFASTLVAYARDPVSFTRDVLRADPQPWQAEFMQAVSDSRFGKLDKQRFAIRSGTGVGKSSGVSFLILWHLACFPDSKIPCTAPTSNQIKAVLWAELRKWVNKIPEELKDIFPYEVTGDEVRLKDNVALARTAREENPESFQGLHARNILLVADEASAVPNAIFMAGQGVMSSHGAITILIGNPTRAIGYFYDSFHRDKHKYWTMQVSCADTTKVRPEIVNPQYVTDMMEKHGENSYEYKVRILGEFHLEDDSIIIPRPWIDAAAEAETIEPDTDYIVWGVDLADGGKDRSAIAKRQGNVLLEKTKSWGGKTANEFVYILADEFFETPFKLRPQEICIDGVGMGRVFTRMVKEALEGENVKVNMINVGGTKPRGDRFVSRRVELWNEGREWFQSMTVKIPRDDTLMSQLSSVEWELNQKNGKMQLIDKKAAGSSPDHADAFLLTFAGSKGKHKSLLTEKIKYLNISADTHAIGSASYL